ncbi:hypothetical protein ACLB6K_24885 (plasmid) [Microcystis aeruginosa FACHB-524]|jgi:hypothetical protein|uniref:hypothetical protein n=3 Tax=Microcystaceae TaxID=1890449 RepID=UPI00258A2421|nr:hypothetical protein [Microcystis sp. M19BS1]MCA2623804.1 hypothetical protein [Microcystis sp. M19BS1]
MILNKLPDFSEVDEVFSTEEKDLSRNGHYGKFYHNLESSAKCPRCQNSSELVEDGPIRTLYRCENCGIFAKLAKRQATDGLRCAIAQGELTTALEILEVAGHLDQDAIAALNRYRGDTHGNAGNAGDDSNVHQKTTASNDRRGFTFCN